MGWWHFLLRKLGVAPEAPVVRIASMTFALTQRTAVFALTQRSAEFELSQRSAVFVLE